MSKHSTRPAASSPVLTRRRPLCLLGAGCLVLLAILIVSLDRPFVFHKRTGEHGTATSAKSATRGEAGNLHARAAERRARQKHGKLAEAVRRAREGEKRFARLEAIALLDDAPTVRLSAVEFLSDNGTTKAIEALAVTPQDPKGSIRESLVHELADIDSPAAKSLIRRFLADSDPRVKRAAALVDQLR